jgi:hypothetical protein
MDNLQQVSFFVSLSSTLLYSSYKGFQLCSKSIKNNIFAVLLSSTLGLQELISTIDNKDNRIVPIVVENVLETYLDVEKYDNLMIHKKTNNTYYQVLVYNTLKSYIKELKKYNKRSVFILFTEQSNLLNKFKIKPQNISVLLPTIKYNIKLQSKMTENEATENAIHRETLTDLPYVKMRFSNKQELENHLYSILNPIKR